MKVINLFGGPGAGKSTLAAALFAAMKHSGVTVELVTEFPKDLTWEGNLGALEDAAYVFGVQHRRLTRLWGKVDYAITDSPLLIQTAYHPTDSAFHDFVIDRFNRFDNTNILVLRSHDYETVGRWQTEEEAEDKADEIEGILLRGGYRYLRVHSEPQLAAVEYALEYATAVYEET